MKKGRILVLAIVVVLMGGLIATGCATPAPAPAPAPTPAPAPAPTPTGPTAENPIVWRWAAAHGSQGIIARGHDKFIEELERKTGGRLEVKVFYSGSMGIGVLDSLPALKAGACDIAYSPGCVNMGYEAVLGWNRVPFLFPDNAAYWKFYTEEFAPVQKDIREKEWGSTMFIEWWPVGPEGSSTLFSKVPMTKAEDFIGMPIRTGGGFITEVFKAVGANPFTISTSELYTAVQRGMIDTVATSYVSGTEVKLWEVCKYVNHIPFEFIRDGCAVSLASLNALPDDLQDIVWETAKENEEYMDQIVIEEEENMLQMLLDGGMEETWPEEGIMETLREKALPAYQQFAEDTAPWGLEWLAMVSAN